MGDPTLPSLPIEPGDREVMDDALRQVREYLAYWEEQGRQGRALRNQAILDASKAGHSRKAIAELVGLGVDSIKAILSQGTMSVDDLADDNSPARAPRVSVPGYVYLMSCAGLHKVGYSKSPQKRLVQVQSFNKHPVTLVGVIPGSRSKETTWHSRFKERHVRGEWFRLSAEDVTEFMAESVSLDAVLDDDVAPDLG